MAAEHENDAHLLRAPATARAFRVTMWGYLFFLPLVSIYLDALGWLLLLAGVRLLRLPRTARLGWIAAAGLVLSLARIIIFGVPDQPPLSYTVMYTASLALSALFLWLRCDTAIVLADLAGKRAVRDQALTRRWLYVLQAALPLIALLLGRRIPTGIAGIALSVGILLLGTVITTLVLALLGNVAKMCSAAMAAPDGEHEPFA